MGQTAGAEHEDHFLALAVGGDALGAGEGTPVERQGTRAALGVPVPRKRGRQTQKAGLHSKKAPIAVATGALRTKNKLVLLGAGGGLGHHTGAQATGAHGQGAHGAVSELMTHALQVGVEAALGLDVGMADKIADLGLFAAEIAFFAHDVLRICRKLCVSFMRQSRV